MVGINRNFSSWRSKRKHPQLPHTNTPNIHTKLFFFLEEIVARTDLIEQSRYHIHSHEISSHDTTKPS